MPDDPSTHPSAADGRPALRAAFAACRAGTEALFADLGDADFRRQPHADFSPPGWHLGHIAYTEAKWLLCHAAGEPLPRPELRETFDVDGLAKAKRGAALPDKPAVLDYAASIRDRTWRCLEATELERDARLWRFVLQHESQHDETITFLRHLLGDRPAGGAGEAGAPLPLDYVQIPGGPVTVGRDDASAIDNERDPHAVHVADFRIARYPVTHAQYARFIEAGGYREPRWWSAAGWDWRAAVDAQRPLYWRDGCANHPVMGVSAHEAQAFARFMGARLPTEAEWEKAASWDPGAGAARSYPWGEALPSPASCNCDRAHKGTTPVDAHPQGASAYGAEDMLGNVWEWTASPFAPYPGFAPWPYHGYSAAYMDGAHLVLRGGSWATRPWAMRASFRNWYLPGIRQILAGFRLAKDGLTD